MPNGSAGIRVSRRSVLASIPFAALTMLAASGCQKTQSSQSAQPRLFGLAATGLDDATVQRSQAAAQQLGKRLDMLTTYDAFAWGKPLPTALLDAAAAAGCTPE